MEGYTDTILIDCNRANSEEGKSNNKEQYSQFTNKIGDGVRLNPGDTISVHSGFVSEVGCGQGVIEFTGRNLETEYDVESTERIEYQKPQNYKENTTEQINPPYGQVGPWNAGYVGFSQKTNTYQLHDNEIHVSINYYKNTNGNGYAHLPRRFDADKVAFDPNSGTQPAPDWIKTLQPITAPAKGIHSGPEDCYNMGRTMLICNHNFQRNYNDLRYYKEGLTPTLGAPYTSLRDQIPAGDQTRLWKYKNDNSRYTIFVLTDNFFGARTGDGYFLPLINFKSDLAQGDGPEESIELKSENRDTLKQNGITDQPRDPCLQEWIRYKEDKLLRAEKGFTAPTSIADDLTSQLNERTETRKIYGHAGGTVPTASNGHTASTVGMEQTEVSIESDSETYKGFGCATAYTFTKETYTQYWQNTLPAGVAGDPNQDNNLKVNEYINNYQTIGVKRPDLWETGREVLKSCSQFSDNNGHDWTGVGEGTMFSGLNSWRNVQYPRMCNRVAYNERTDRNGSEIWTQWEWTEANLKLLKAWFDAQGRDESLFNNYSGSMSGNNNVDNVAQWTGLNSGNSRFIHMNMSDNPGGYLLNMNALGSDEYEDALLTTPTKVAFSSNQSAPLFIYWDKVAMDNDWGGETWKDMYYGFALKRSVTKTEAGATFSHDIIAFNTAAVGGIPTEFFTNGSSTPPAAGTDNYYINGTHGGPAQGDYTRKLGYDPHFNAYGTDAIILYAGYLNGNANEKTNYSGLGTRPLGASTAYQQAQFIQKRLVGASAPQVTFDDTSSKFNFTALHTPEYTGNVYNSGATSAPISLDAGKPVWYLNKRIHKTAFCPDMMPYQIDFTSTVGVSPQYYTPHNWNVEPWAIFDADGGIFIESFNVNKLDWDKSMMGILGFTYDQFNSPNPAETRQTRINDNIVFDPSGSLTTNAVVNGSDIIQWRTNQYGANFYNNQYPIGMNDTSALQEWSYLPVVSEDQISANIEAEKLGRKMLTPYYVIRSDIISDHKFLGGEDGGQALPIVHIVNKENGFGDFFFQGESENLFTVTKSRVVSDITTSIHNPDMTLATTTDGSGIIYRIQKNNTSDLNIASEILNKKKK